MASVSKCRTRLISDEPVAKDNFGSHERVAEAIAELIQTSDGGKAIGLEGGWGSGKTTIVEILCQRFSADKQYYFCLFDAWAHEGDPLRRTFLESLIDRLCELKWLEKQDYWQEQKEIIAQRREVKETNTEPHLKPLGTLVLFLIAFIPVGIAFLNAGLRDTPNLTIDFRAPLANKFLLGLLLTIGPLLAVLLGLLVEVTRGRYAKSPNQGAFLWAMLVNRAITRERTETNKTANSTSVEFEAKFSELMAAALSGKARKIVIVLDNLDRIGGAEALKIWSTMQTFLHPRATASADWLKRLWVIMPYDPDGISALWSKSKGDEEKKAGPPPAMSDDKILVELASTESFLITRAADKKESGGRENPVALSFLDKSFQLRFEVPPPMLSDWHDYLIDIFHEAFPDHKLEDFHNPYRLYAWYLNKRKRLPNPRQIKLYVNQIGVIHRQWGDTFPLSHMAYYVLLRRMNYPLVEMVLKGELPEAEVENLIDENAADNLAALAFNVDVATAKQIVLNNPLRDAFELRSVDKLNELYLQHKDNGFWEALDTMDWQSFENDLLANAAYCLRESRLLDKTAQPVEHHSEIQSILNALRKAGLSQANWQPFNQEMAQGLASLQTLIPETGFIERTLRAVSTNFVWSSASNFTDVANWIAAVKIVRDGLLPTYDDAYTKGLLEPVMQRFQPGQPIPHKELNPLLEFLVELSAFDGAAQESLAALATDGEMLKQLNSLILTTPNPVAPETTGSIAWCLFLLLRHQSAAIPTEALYHGASYKSADRPTKPSILTAAPVAESLLNLLTRYNQMNLLFSLNDADPKAEPFILESLKIAAADEKAASQFSVAMLMQHWKLFFKLHSSDSSPSPLETLLLRLVTETSFVDELSQITFKPELARLYRELIRQKALENHNFQQWLVDSLQGIDRQLWKADLQSGGELFQLLLNSSPLLKRLRLSEYQEALLTVARELIAGQYSFANPYFNHEGGRTLINYSSGEESERDDLRRRLLEMAIQAEGNIADDFFKVFGNEISYPEIIGTDEAVISQLFEPTLKKASEAGLAWLNKALASNLETISREAKAYWQFRDAVRDQLYQNGYGESVELTRKKDGPRATSLLVRRTDTSEYWDPDERQDRFVVDYATAEAALADGTFEAGEKVLFGEQEWIFGKNSRELVNLGRLLEIPPLTAEKYRA
jgi:hypothetical protein